MLALRQKGLFIRAFSMGIFFPIYHNLYAHPEQGAGKRSLGDQGQDGVERKTDWISALTMLFRTCMKFVL